MRSVPGATDVASAMVAETMAKQAIPRLPRRALDRDEAPVHLQASPGAVLKRWPRTCGAACRLFLRVIMSPGARRYRPW